MSNARFQSRSSTADAARSAAPSVHVVTFGCQMNKYDSLLAEGRFRARGWRVTAELEQADVVLFNTCSVREHAEERAYSWVGEVKALKRRRPDVVIGVLGCLAQRAGAEVFERAEHVDVVCGTRRFHLLPELVDEVRARRADPERAPRESRVLDLETETDVDVDRTAEPYTGGLAGYLAVMRGCDLNCTFCIVPSVRGRVRSRPLAALVDEARWMIDQGARAITLLGQTVDSYGEDLPAPGAGEARGRGRQGRPALADVIYALQELAGLARIRLVTSHPSYVTAELAQALADCPKAERFLPLPAQSGSDRMLRAMKRGYTTDLYRRRVELLRARVPDLELGSDWIVGFPGEQDADCAASTAFLAEIGFVQGYVFQYDPRPGTAAAELADDVPPAVKQARNQELLRAAEASGLARMRAHVGAERSVLVEQVARRPGVVQGRTEHGLLAFCTGDAALVGQTVRVRVLEASAFGLGAERIEAHSSAQASSRRAVLSSDRAAASEPGRELRHGATGPELPVVS